MQVQSIASSRRREALAKQQGVPLRQLVMKRPEGLSRGPGTRWKRKLPPLVYPHIICSQVFFLKRTSDEVTVQAMYVRTM